MSRAFYLHDRWGNQIDTLPTPVSIHHKDATDGEDTLSFQLTDYKVEKGQRVVWKDRFQRWHEQIIVDDDSNHSADGMPVSVYGENSLHELAIEEHIGETQMTCTAQAAMTRALQGTGWKVGRVEVEGTHSVSWYFISPYAALLDIQKIWGGEFETHIEVEGDRVVSREVSLVLARGSDKGCYFEYGFNMTAIRRKVEADDVYTAMYGFGKTLQSYDQGGDSNIQRKVTFGVMNGGVDWVGDEEARQKWGLPDGHGGKKHAFGTVEFSECVDPRELMDLTREELKKHTQPKVVYTGTVLALSEGGITNAEDVDTGDIVHVRDRQLDERFESRALSIDRDLLDETNTVVTIGNYESTYTNRVDEKLETVDDLNQQAPAWNDVVAAEKTWLDYFMDNVNSFMNQAGGYVYWEQGVGLTVYDRPLDKNPTMAIRLNGAGFRIANSKNPDGSWRWRTFGTGDGFTADLITAGTIQGGSNHWDLSSGVLEFSQGKIQSKDGRSVWDMTNNSFKTTNMTADNMTANGTFVCGTSTNGMKLTSDGKLAGYRNGREVGSINYMGQIQSETGQTVYGLLVQGGTIGFNVDEIYTGSYRGTSGSAQYVVVRNVTQDEDKTIHLATGQILVGFHNGICTYFDVW